MRACSLEIKFKSIMLQKEDEDILIHELMKYFKDKNLCDWDDSNRDDNDDAGKFPERGRQHRGYDLLTHWTMEQILEYFAIDTLRYLMF